MADAKTVDNLGMEVHQRYIDDIRLLSEEEVQKVFKTPSVATRAEVLKTAPQTLEIDRLFGLQENLSSPFAPPPNFVLATNIFTYQLIPNLGPLNEIIEKLETLEEKNKSKKKKKDTQEEKQRKQLLKFATLMVTLNKILAEIKRRKDEYHKG